MTPAKQGEGGIAGGRAGGWRAGELLCSPRLLQRVRQHFCDSLRVPVNLFHVQEIPNQTVVH